MFSRRLFGRGVCCGLAVLVTWACACAAAAAVAKPVAEAASAGVATGATAVDTNALPPVLVLNLDRRPDRWAAFTSRAAAAGLPPSVFARVAATDGGELQWHRDELEPLFRLTAVTKDVWGSHRYQRGAIGCALSHVRVWEAVARAGGFTTPTFAALERDAVCPTPGPLSTPPGADWSQGVVVLEDDVTFAPDFVAAFSRAWAATRHNASLGVLYLGLYHNDPTRYGDTLLDNGVTRALNPLPTRVVGAGAFAYLIRPWAAAAYLTSLARSPMHHAVDWFMFRQFAAVPAQVVAPHIVMACARDPSDAAADTDIQHVGQPIHPLPQPRVALSPLHDSHVLVHVDVPLKASAKTTATSRHRLLVPKWGFNVERAEDFVTAAGVGMDVVPTVVAHVQTALEPFKTSQWRTWACCASSAARVALTWYLCRVLLRATTCMIRATGAARVARPCAILQRRRLCNGRAFRNTTSACCPVAITAARFVAAGGG